MAKGTVKWFDENKGYGYIAREDGEDVFVHHTALAAAGCSTLSQGDRVEFELVAGRKGLSAANVVRLD
ncbi:MAG: cold-shock protein [Planctomycetota bacterium]|nr:MAG: cold-shock protein [Planctomycetota bacterium]